MYFILKIQIYLHNISVILILSSEVVKGHNYKYSVHGMLKQLEEHNGFIIKLFEICKYIQVFLVLWCFVLLCFIDTEFLKYWRFVYYGNPYQPSLLAPFFPIALNHCVSWSHFGSSHSISNFFIIITIGKMIVTHWSPDDN